LRIVDERLWQRVGARRVHVRARYDMPTQFGKTRAEYGTYLLSGRLVCAECGGTLSIRSSGPHRYGCTRHWRRGSSACSNNVLVRRDLAEAGIVELLKAKKLYTPDAVARLVNAVNDRLSHRRPIASAERARWETELREARTRLDGLRQFIEQGDEQVRQWLTE